MTMGATAWQQRWQESKVLSSVHSICPVSIFEFTCDARNFPLLQKSGQKYTHMYVCLCTYIHLFIVGFAQACQNNICITSWRIMTWMRCSPHWNTVSISTYYKRKQVECMLINCSSIISPLHTRAAGSGVQVPSTVLPSDVQFALILPAGTYPGAHMKNISAPTSVLWYGLIKPFRGPMGIPQLTGRKEVMVVANSQRIEVKY